MSDFGLYKIAASIDRLADAIEKIAIALNPPKTCSICGGAGSVVNRAGSAQTLCNTCGGTGKVTA